jgi:homogentisate 1,2-dioxygenase
MAAQSIGFPQLAAAPVVGNLFVKIDPSIQDSISLKYQSGFGNEFATEALAGILPIGQNSPQRVARGLYAEVLSGTSFTAPRNANRRTWMYRKRPSAAHGAFAAIGRGLIRSAPFSEAPCAPNRLRWNPPDLPANSDRIDFVSGLRTYDGNGDIESQRGCAVHLYCANASMSRVFSNADGELLILPELGRLLLHTELGRMLLSPGEIAVIPRGMKFRVLLLDDNARGYVCENYGQMLRLPELGPIGSNGLANPRDFETPSAWFDNDDGPTEVILKFLGDLWRTHLDHSPFDVVAWHGNNVPYKFDLALFNVMGSVNFDHPDPSILTVLNAPSEVPGTANVDFVIFPSRWVVTEHTFRPPWYHRNLMSEFMGLLRGTYEAKPQGFVPGGASLHNCMSAHGPDEASYERAVVASLGATYLADTLAFMIESRYIFRPTLYALECTHLQ